MEENEKEVKFLEPEMVLEEKKEEIKEEEKVETKEEELSHTEEIKSLIDKDLVEKQEKKTGNGKLIAIVAVITLIVLVGMSFIFFMSREQYQDNYVTYTIKEGYTTKQIYNMLEKLDVVRSGFCANLWAKVTGKTEYKLGTYKIPTNVSAFKVIDTFVTQEPTKNIED